MEHFRQEDIDELFTDLKVIGSIRQHQRISTCGPHIRIDDSMLQPLKRAWLGEDRESNLRGIKRSMQTANALIDLSLAPPYTPIKRSFLSRIQVELENTIRGLKNLQTTYEGDITTCSKLDVHIENITNKFNSIREFIAHHQQKQIGGDASSSPIAIPASAPLACGGTDTCVMVGSADTHGGIATSFGTPTNAETLDNYLQGSPADSSVSAATRSDS